MPKVSIVIPVFNRSHCIQRALASIRVQQVGECELIVGDDASSDGTWEIVRGEFPDSRIARLDVNSGAAAARNAAMRFARGEYLAFLDSDDEWLVGKLAAQLAFLESNPNVVGCATSHIYQLRNGRQREEIVKNPSDWSRRLQSGQSFHGASTPVVRRNVLESVGMQDESLRVLEDWDWMLRITQKHQFHVLTEPYALIHENAPSNADFTYLATQRFLAKHDATFLIEGEAHQRRVISQHWENAARCFFRHSRNAEGCRCLLKSIKAAPVRNLSMVLAFPIAALDAQLGTKFLRKIIAARSGLSIV
ncbi:glycosyltransferase [bacterium]|nr:glycosyltransferase [bacterium]NBS52414.1 glycosyltransferase [Spartobacteria bacterium]